MEQTTYTNFREERIDTPQGDETKKYNRNILTDLLPYDFSDDIKMRANYIYNKMNHATHRAKKRVLLLFFCVYNAYKELEIPILPADLGKKFKLTQGQMQKTLSMFSPLQTGYRPITRKLSILDYIPTYCEHIGLDGDHINNMLLLASNLLDNNKLSNLGPQTTAAGFIKLYLLDNGIELEDKNLLSKVTDRSNATIEAKCMELRNIDN